MILFYDLFWNRTCLKLFKPRGKEMWADFFNSQLYLTLKPRKEIVNHKNKWMHKTCSMSLVPITKVNEAEDV